MVGKTKYERRLKMVWDFMMSSVLKEENDKRTYIFPETTQQLLEKKAEEIGATPEDFLTLMVAVGLNEARDLREVFIIQEVDRLREENKEVKNLEVGGITLHFDRVVIQDTLDKGEFLINVDYFLGDSKIASRVEKPLEKVNSIGNVYKMYDEGTLKK